MIKKKFKKFQKKYLKKKKKIKWWLYM